jgi:hypothetical protein
MKVEWTNGSLFYRQVNPNWYKNGVPTSQAFGPTPKDRDQLSLDDASKVSAEGSWRHFTENLGLSSAGTWAVSLGEVEETGDLMVVASPIEVPQDTTKNNPAHCHIDFSQVSSKGQKKRKAQHLAIKATARGRLYVPASGGVM